MIRPIALSRCPAGQENDASARMGSVKPTALSHFPGPVALVSPPGPAPVQRLSRTPIASCAQ